MKMSAKLAVLTAAAVFSFSTIFAMSGGFGNHGTDILHLSIRKAMHDDGVETGAAGRVDLKQNRQGHADNQRLDISIRGLATNGAYQLVALLDDDTNSIAVADFSSDARGRARLQYRSMGNGIHGGGLGRGKSPLPVVLDPVSNIRELTVINGSTQAILTADLTDPDKLQYLIKRDLSTNNVDALLRIKATTRKSQFRLAAFGLNPTNDYLLVLNDVVVQTNSTDASGRLNIFSLVQNPTDILDLHAVALWDSASNVVVSTTLP